MGSRQSGTFVTRLLRGGVRPATPGPRGQLNKIPTEGIYWAPRPAWDCARLCSTHSIGTWVRIYVGQTMLALFFFFACLKICRTTSSERSRERRITRRGSPSSPTTTRHKRRAVNAFMAFSTSCSDARDTELLDDDHTLSLCFLNKSYY